MSGAACKRFLHLSPGADTRGGAAAPCHPPPGKRPPARGRPRPAAGRSRARGM